MLAGEAAPRGLDRRLPGIAGHTEDVMGISPGHGRQCIDAALGPISGDDLPFRG